MKFIGHLDCMRFFQKAIRRAKLDVAYSKGYSPHQLMSFASPLGVGVTSDGEYIDVEFYSLPDISLPELVTYLNQFMTDEIFVTDIEIMPDGFKNSMSLLIAADYMVVEKEFEDYWNKHQKRLILNAPKALRDEYIESTKLDSPIDWVCFILPVALGIGLQPILDIQSEILSWAVVLLIVVVCFAVMQLVKPMLQKKKSTIQVVKSIKAFYYEVYKKNGLKKLEPWN